MPNDDLVSLFNQCVSTRTVPTKWMVTLLVGIQKKQKPAEDPNSYRIIALECCLLKVFTLLCATRLRQWMAAQDVLQPAQNGFRKGYRTNNCSFILRCAIDRARNDGDNLYVAFMDLTNAFPSTNLPTLWRKLFGLGARGPIMDTLRVLYERMEYTVVQRDPFRSCSSLFRSLWGILAGDSASTDLFNVYMSDFRPPASTHHIRLNGTPISNLLQADDLVLLATQWFALQALVAYAVGVWLSLHGFGPVPSNLPDMKVGPDTIPIVDASKYVGITFQSTSRNIFAQHYHLQASAALRECNAVFLVEGHVGSLPPSEAILLYKARVDPQLTSGCEISPDVDLHLLAELEEVQVLFLRRLLGLHSRSPVAALFTETGIMPLRFRRAVLCLHYLQYLLSLTEGQYAYAAFQDSKLLWLASVSTGCWMSDVDNVLAALPTPSGCPALRLLPAHVSDTDAVHTILIKEITRRSSLCLYESLQQNSALLLLHAYSLPMNGHRRLQGYLSAVHIPAHRKALTRVLTSCHRLRVQSLKGLDIPRDKRVCRACSTGAIEDVMHCAFYCAGRAQFFLWRAEFFARTEHVVDMKKLLGRVNDTSAFQHFLINGDDDCFRALGRLIHRVTAVFDSVPDPIVLRAKSQKRLRSATR